METEQGEQTNEIQDVEKSKFVSKIKQNERNSENRSKKSIQVETVVENPSETLKTHEKTVKVEIIETAFAQSENNNNVNDKVIKQEVSDTNPLENMLTNDKFQKLYDENLNSKVQKVRTVKSRQNHKEITSISSRTPNFLPALTKIQSSTAPLTYCYSKSSSSIEMNSRSSSFSTSDNSLPSIKSSTSQNVESKSKSPSIPRRYPVVKCSAANPWGDPPDNLDTSSSTQKFLGTSNRSTPEAFSSAKVIEDFEFPDTDNHYLTRGFTPANNGNWKMYGSKDGTPFIHLKENIGEGGWTFIHKKSAEYGYAFACSICKKIKAKLVDNGTLYFDEYHQCPSKSSTAPKRRYKDLQRDLKKQEINVKKWIQQNKNECN